MTDKKLPPMGGTDIMFNRLNSAFDLPSIGVNMIKSVCSEDLLQDDVKNMLWQHLSYDQEFVAGMKNKFFVSAIDAFVYVSHWQYEKFRYMHNTPLDKSFVIRNAIDEIGYKKKSTSDKIRLVYASAPFRGLNLLLDSISLLNRDDFELHIYSSALMYGTDWAELFGNEFDHLFEVAGNMKNVTVHGYQKNETVVDAMKDAHIFAYPSVFEETSCLSMIEAGAAGCRLVTTNIGALPETGCGFNWMVEPRTDHKQMLIEYTSRLSEAIDEARLGYNGARQSEHFNSVYSWETQKQNWEKLFNKLLA